MGPLPIFQNSSPSTPQPVASGPPVQTPWRSSGPRTGPGLTEPSEKLHPAPSGTLSPSPSVWLPPYHYSSKPSKHKTHLFQLSFTCSTPASDMTNTASPVCFPFILLPICSVCLFCLLCLSISLFCSVCHCLFSPCKASLCIQKSAI